VPDAAPPVKLRLRHLELAGKARSHWARSRHSGVAFPTAEASQGGAAGHGPATRTRNPEPGDDHRTRDRCSASGQRRAAGETPPGRHLAESRSTAVFSAETGKKGGRAQLPRPAREARGRNGRGGAQNRARPRCVESARSKRCASVNAEGPPAEAGPRAAKARISWPGGCSTTASSTPEKKGRGTGKAPKQKPDAEKERSTGEGAPAGACERKAEATHQGPETHPPPTGRLPHCQAALASPGGRRFGPAA